MELKISNLLVERLTDLERTIAQFPTSAEHLTYYRQRAVENRLEDIITLGKSMELSLSKEDAKELQKKSAKGVVQQHFKLLNNSINVIKYTRSVRKGTFNTSVMQHENKLLGDGFSDFWEEGKIRSSHEKPTYLHDGLRHRTALPNYQLWTDLRQEMAQPDQYAHPLIQAASIAFHVVHSYPFLQFSLQTALLSSFTVMRQTRYWARGTLTIMSSIWNTLQRTDFSRPPRSEALTLFTERVATDFRLQAVTILDTLEHQATIAPHIRASLNDRQHKALTYFKQNKKLTRKKYAKMMEIAIATAFRDLNDLYLKGLIKPVGKGRGTAYVLAKLSGISELEMPKKEKPTSNELFSDTIPVNTSIDDDLFVE